MVEFTQDMFDAICERISGGESLRSVCRDKSYPSRQTFLKWVANDPELADQYARARDAQTEALVDELIDIADDRAGDFDEEGNIDHDAIARAKLRIDTRKWIASKMLPKKYGEKIAIGGASDLGPIKTEEVSPLERINRKLAGIAAGAGAAGDTEQPDD